ncbi:similar to two-component response regulator [Leptolyngbya sp. NIES-3755]|nr:similar to two-component response regulator [Leptolyngbya sp. NIES-3755]
MLNSNKLLNPEILKNVQILIVENDRDNRDLYAFVLESCGARVTTTSSVKDGLASLNRLMPGVLICEMRFLGEGVYPLIRRAKYLALKHGSIIPILITSTCSIAEFTQQSKFNTEAYLLKPVNLNSFVDKVWNLTQRSRVPEVGWLN